MNNPGDFHSLEIMAAFRLLFSSDGGTEPRSVDGLRHTQLKAAYRRKAMTTHPDLHACRGEAIQRMYSERFIQLTRAYEILSQYIRLRPERSPCDAEGSPTAAEAGGAKPRQTTRPFASTGGSSNRTTFREKTTDAFWRSSVPRRYLRFAEFLYFSRVITWKSFVSALVWQRRQRPRIGEIARRWRWVSDSQVEAAVMDRRPGERIGEVLLRHRLLTPLGLGILLRQQRRFQKPIGLYFVRQGLMSEWEVGRHLRYQRLHNLRFASASTENPRAS
ncbi:MAG: DnaJ domain-containing protein [Syntrophobacteraceae bacterium]|jgi:hypothetical protein|nr:DnaJ domain-containing protein [Syntrophobacteraceae bacterium]